MKPNKWPYWLYPYNRYTRLYLQKTKRRTMREKYFGQPVDRDRGSYRPKFVCFNCRRVIRVRISKQKENAKRCGNCGGLVTPIHPMFKPPPSNTNRGRKAWREIEKTIKQRIDQ